MADFRELRTPRRPSNNLRGGDEPCPRLYSDRLDLSTYARVHSGEVGTVRSPFDFALAPTSLFDPSSGQLTACLAARALAQVAPDTPLQGIWFASGEVTVDSGLVKDAVVDPVSMLGYKAYLAAMLLVRLASVRPKKMLRDREVPIAPCLVSSEQDLVEARTELEEIGHRDGWAYTTERQADGSWLFIDRKDGYPVARLVFFAVATVSEAESVLAQWSSERESPAWVEPAPPPMVEPPPLPRDDFPRRRGLGWLGVLTLVLGASAFGAWVSRQDMLPRPSPEVSRVAEVPQEDLPPMHFELSEDDEAEGSSASDSLPVASDSEPMKVPTESANVVEPARDEVTETLSEPSRSIRERPTALRGDDRSRRSGFAKPFEKRARRNEPSSSSPSSVDEPSVARGRNETEKVSQPSRRAPAAEASVARAQNRTTNALVRPRSSARTVESNPSPKTKAAVGSAPISVAITTDDGMTLNAPMGARIRSAVTRCIRRGECPHDEGDAVEVRFVENLVNPTNPILKIGEGRCFARDVSACFR